MPDSKVYVQPAIVDGEGVVRVIVGQAEAVLTPSEARDLVRRIELALKWRMTGGPESR